MGNIKLHLCRGLTKGTLLFVFGWFGSASFIYAWGDSTKELAAPKVEAKASDIQKDEAFKKPDWLKEVSVTFKESYDSNIYQANFGNLANKDSWISTVIPRVAFDFAPLLDLDPGEKCVETLALSYAPEINTYHGAESENYTSHKIGTAIKGRLDDFSYGLENNFTYVDGREQSLESLFAGASASADLSPSSSGTFRERRDQFQYRAKIWTRYEVSDEVFVRPVATGLWYDLHVEERPAVGYVNFPDRYDANAGFDLGYKLNPLTGLTSIKGLSNDYAVTLGYRYGHTQQQMVYVPVGMGNLTQYKSDYQRVLVGIEGQIYKWLKAEFQIGPDFRNYGRGYAPIAGSGTAATTTFNDANETTLFFEGGATVALTKEDSLIIKAKQWQWVASTGQGVYTDLSYSINYKRKWTKELTSNIGYGYIVGEYHAPKSTDDNVYTFSGGLEYAFDENWSATADYSFGRGLSDDSTTRAREFNRHLVSLGVKWAL